MVVDLLLHSWFSASLAIITFLFLLLLSTHVISFFLDKRGLKDYPGPLFARLSDVWLTWTTARGRINIVVAEAHKAYGPFVRIAPNHISIADPSALQSIYNQNPGILKSDFYDVFASFGGRRSTFTTRNRGDHLRKRKVLANTFSQQTTLEFEPLVRQYIGGVIKQWDRMCRAASQGKGGIVGDMPWSSSEGRAVFDTLKWFNFMVFDIIGDLVFRAPFGMTERATDLALVAKRAEDAVSAYDANEVKLEYDAFNVITTTNERTAFVVVIGQLPARVRELVKKLPLPWVRRGNDGFRKLAAMAATAVARRAQHSTTRRNDILTKYFDATDEKGNTMDNLEISAEALGLLIAGTDTTSNSVAAITFYIAQNPAAQAKLQRELDHALGTPNIQHDGDELALLPYEKIKNLPYLQDVVNEGLRLFSTIGLGLPRVVPEEGLTVLGHAFAPGTVVSVPTYIIHHDKTIWGEDAESFNPERWSKGDRAAMMKAFAPFSIGPRACIGRNLASMELLMVVANVFHRFEAMPAYPGQTIDIHDGFIRKPSSSVVALKHRGRF